MVNRSRADHYHLSISLPRISIIDNPKCKCNLEDEIFNHIYFSNNLYKDRIKFIKNFRKARFQLYMLIL